MGKKTYKVNITSATPCLSLHEHKDIGTSDFTFSKENYTFFFKYFSGLDREEHRSVTTHLGVNKARNGYCHYISTKQCILDFASHINAILKPKKVLKTAHVFIYSK